MSNFDSKRLFTKNGLFTKTVILLEDTYSLKDDEVKEEDEYTFLSLGVFKPSYYQKQCFKNQKRLMAAKNRIKYIEDLLINKHNFSYGRKTSSSLYFSYDNKQRFFINIHSVKNSLISFEKYFCVIEFTLAPVEFVKKYKMYPYYDQDHQINDWVSSYNIPSYRHFKKLIADYVYHM